MPPAFDPGKNNQCCTEVTGPVHSGNPINIFVGNKTQTVYDFVDNTGHLSFARYYSSALVPTNSGTTLTSRWRHRFQANIFTNSENGVQVWMVNRPGGDSYMFRPDGMNWEPDADVAEKLVATSNPAGWAVTATGGEVERYNSAGRLLSITYLDGDVVNVTYDGSNRPILLKDRRGRALSLTYVGGLLDSVTLPDGKLVRYTYDAQRLASVLYQINNDTLSPQFVTVQYLYEDLRNPQLLSGVVDESSQRYATWEYDGFGRAISSRHGSTNGGIDLVSVSRGAGMSWLTTPLGDTVEFTYQQQFGRAKISSADKVCPTCTGPSSQARTYDVNGYLDLSMDFDGNTTDHDYNAAGLEIQRIDATNDVAGEKRTTQTDWNATFRVPTERRTYDAADTLVAKSAWTYNARGQALTATQTDPVTAAVRTSATTYCEAADITLGTCPLVGLVTTGDGPRTDVADTTAYIYYANDEATCASSPTTCPHRKGDLWKVTDALGRVTETLAYDGAGRVLSVKDANGVITDLEYHPRGWLTARKVRGTNNAIETDDQITQIEYWPTGLVKKVTQPDGAFTAYTYDAAHRLTDIADNAGNTIHYTLDNAGNRTADETKDAGNTLRRTLSRVYNQLGQLQTVNDAYSHATGFTYDANGNNQLVTDALSRVTDNDYDPLNRLVRTLQDVGGIAAETKFEYDALDNLTKVTDPKGLDTTYQYNGFGDLTQLTSPDTGITTYTYDSAGNRQTQTDARGITSTYSYDALNRLTGIAYPTTSLNVGYVYDTANAVCTTGETFALGRLTQMTDSSGDTQYCYDRFGNLVRKVQTTNGHSFELRYAYTKAGQLQSVVYPDGAIVDYMRDGQGRITEVGATPAAGVREVLLHQAMYYPFGPVAGWTYGNSRTMARPLNQNYQPTAIVDNAAGGLSLGYEFDAVGNLSKLYNADQSATLAQYGYDALNRLADVKDGPTGTVLEHYGYDASGNRTSFTNAGGTTAYTYPGSNHRLAQVGATVRSYDNAGNTTQIGGTAKEFVYNDAGRMSQVKASDTEAMNYQLNGKGEQVRKYLGASNTYTIYDEAGRWIGDYDSSGNALQQAIWLDDRPVGLLASNQLKYVQPDHLGTPRAVIDPTTDVAIWAWELKGEAFGSTAPNQDPDGNGTTFVLNMRFPGQRYDAVSGLNQNGYRDYEPAIGRYPQSDPIGLDGGLSTYSYVSDNPLVWIDQFGLQTTTVDAYCARYGPAACAEAMGAKPPNLSPPALGAGVVAAAWCWFTGCTVRNEGWIDDPAAAAEHEAYKARAAQTPPPDMDECARLLWLLQREQDVIAAMTAWDARWLAGRHAQAIQQRMNAVSNLRRKYEQQCGRCPL